MTNIHSIKVGKLKGLKPFTAFAIKHRGADHITRNGLYETRDDAVRVFNTVPVRDQVEYEIVEVSVKVTRPLKVRRLKIKKV